MAGVAVRVRRLAVVAVQTTDQVRFSIRVRSRSGLTRCYPVTVLRIGSDEDPHRFAQQRPVLRSVRHCQLQQTADMAIAKEHRQEQVRRLSCVAHLQRSRRIGAPQEGGQVADQPIGSLPVEGLACLGLGPSGAVQGAELPERLVLARQTQELLADGHQRLVRPLRIQPFSACHPPRVRCVRGPPP